MLQSCRAVPSANSDSPLKPIPIYSSLKGILWIFEISGMVDPPAPATAAQRIASLNKQGTQTSFGTQSARIVVPACVNS